MLFVRALRCPGKQFIQSPMIFGEFFHRDFPDYLLIQERHINELELLTVVISVSSLENCPTFLRVFGQAGPSGVVS